MPGNYTKPKKKTLPDPTKILWCPVEHCPWHQSDSYASRKRMGEHIANDHPNEVIYSEGEVPEDLEAQSNRKERRGKD